MSKAKWTPDEREAIRRAKAYYRYRNGSRSIPPIETRINEMFNEIDSLGADEMTGFALGWLAARTPRPEVAPK